MPIFLVFQTSRAMTRTINPHPPKKKVMGLGDGVLPCDPKADAEIPSVKIVNVK
ncbi:MAG TPA: hypothetical protein VK752_06340 [Bryobacteraceae bacterium]|nr:hypothetical protein [Bryobacteraceae bacterium]